MSGPPLFSNVPWSASSDFPSEHHTVPPPGVSSSSPIPIAPPHTPAFAWSSAMTMPISGGSPGVVVGMYPLPSPMKLNQAHVSGNLNAHAWPSTNNPQVVRGAYPQHPPANANVSTQTFPSYGVQNSNLGIHTSSYGTGMINFGIQSFGYGGAQATGPIAQDDGHRGQIMNHDNTSYNAMGPLFSSNAPSMQKSSSMPHPTIESHPLHANNVTKLKEVDPKSLLVNLKSLIAQANEAAQKVASLMNISLSMLPRKGLNPQTLGDGVIHDVEPNDHSTDTNGEMEGADRSSDFTTGSEIFTDTLKSVKGYESFYKDAPGVVQVPVFTDDVRIDCCMLPDFAKGERWAELTSQNVFKGDALSRNTEVQGTPLPSRFWLFSKEVSMWKDLPSKYSASLVQAAAALTMVKRADLKRWLFTHSSSYGVAYSTSLANHIVVLLVFCLRAVYREAITLDKSEEEVGSVECRVLSDSAYWLSSQLSLIYDPVASKNLVLGLFKFALEAAAYCATFSKRDSSQNLQEEESSKVECVEAVPNSPEQKLHDCSCTHSESHGNKIIRSSCVGDGVLHLQHLAAAVLAIQSQGVLVKCQTCDSMAFQVSPSQRSVVHSMIIKRAEEVRATRADFRAVLEHDGLIWQRTQNQEFKKNKTKEEILAEERDYKRRRMSYRGKKAQRTPSEVLRDIIEGHMEEIVAAGGIGCFGRVPQDMQLVQSESDLSALGTKERSDAVQTTRMSSRDAEGKELGTSFSAHSRYSRSESRGSFGTDRGDRHRSTSVSLSSNSPRNNFSHQTRYDRSSHDHSEDKFHERKYESNRKDSRWERSEESERSVRHHSGKQYSSRWSSKDRSNSPK